MFNYVFVTRVPLSSDASFSNIKLRLHSLKLSSEPAPSFKIETFYTKTTPRKCVKHAVNLYSSFNESKIF